MAITPNAARRISQAVTTVERSIGSGSKLGLDPTTNYGSYLVKTPSDGIPARSGTTLGSASCTIQVVDKSNDSISDGSSVDVLNLSLAAVAGDSYIAAIRTKSGDYVAIENSADSLLRIIELKATEAFDTTDSSFSGIIVSDSSVITILNINVTPTATVWGMEGSNGDSIYGQWVSGTTYQAIQKACV